ncbi:MAG TPA: hypothetical protein VIN77_04905, partial [Aurantimonas sp.]
PTRNRCVITGPCRLRGALAEALDAYLAVLDRFTLADLVIARTPLQDILGLPAGPGVVALANGGPA